MSATVENVRYGTTLVAITCGTCGIPFGLPNEFWKARRSDACSFYCPNGHYIGFGESDADREKKRADEALRQLTAARVSRDAAWDQARAAERRRAAAKGQLTKVKNRVANGVCPCCNRTFVDLQRHMASKHPDYAPRTTEPGRG